MRAALRQGVMQSVYRALVPLREELPSDLRDRMRREVHGNAARNCYLASEMVRLCEVLDQHGVRALALKGPALAADVYGDVTLRQFTDLDLLVREKDLGATFAALAANGFHTKAPLKRLAGKHSSAWEVTLVREAGLFVLDLHWRLSPPYFPFTPEGDELWDRAVQVDLGPGRVSTLCPEDLILFLCAHAAKHGWQSLSGVCDVAQAVRVHDYDWEQLARRVNALGSMRILLLGVLLAHDLLHASIPAAMISAARAEPSVTYGGRTFCNYFYRLESDSPGLLQRWSIPLAMIPRWRARCRYALTRGLAPRRQGLRSGNLALRALSAVLGSAPTPSCVTKDNRSHAVTSRVRSGEAKDERLERVKENRPVEGASVDTDSSGIIRASEPVLAAGDFAGHDAAVRFRR
jgi:hypothetical protein